MCSAVISGASMFAMSCKVAASLAACSAALFANPRMGSRSPPGPIWRSMWSAKLTHLERASADKGRRLGASSFCWPGAKGKGFSSIESMRAPYRLIEAPLSGAGSRQRRVPAAVSGDVTRTRERRPWSARVGSESICAPTSGWAMRCIDKRRPWSKVAPSKARTRRIGAPSHIEERPVAVLSLFSSLRPCPPMNCPPWKRGGRTHTACSRNTSLKSCPSGGSARWTSKPIAWNRSVARAANLLPAPLSS